MTFFGGGRVTCVQLLLYRSGLIVLSSLDTAYLNGIECRAVAVVARRKSMRQWIPVLRRGLMPFCSRCGNFPGSDQTGSREFISSSSLPLARSLQVRRDLFCTKPHVTSQ